MPPPSKSDAAGSTQQVSSLTFTTNIPPPGRLKLKENLSENWKKCSKVWGAYETVKKLNEKESRFRSATFITCIGPDALGVHNSLPFRSDEEKQDKCRFESMKVLLYWPDKCYLRTLQAQQLKTRTSGINRCLLCGTASSSCNVWFFLYAS